MDHSASPTAYGYFLDVRLGNVRAFRSPVSIDLSDGDGKPARWTVILGDNGTGKTTALQAIASLRPSLFPYVVDNALRASSNTLQMFSGNLAGYGDGYVELATTIALSREILSQPIFISNLNLFTEAKYRKSTREYRTDSTALPKRLRYVCYVFAYGGYRRLPTGTTLVKDVGGSVDSLFDSEARLTDPVDWYLQRDYAANNPRNTDEDRAIATRSRDLISRVLASLLPDVTGFEPVTTDARSGTTELHAHTPYGRVRVRDLGLGYQSTLAWVVDLAARMIAAYPDLDDPLTGAAVVLVDEIDLHLHPRWQRTLVQELTRHFPNVQFIATAHSPLIVQAAPDANIVVLRREGDTVVVENDPVAVRNWRVDQILTSDLFGLDGVRDPETDRLIARREALLAKSKLTARDRQELDILRTKIGELPQGESAEQREAMDIIRRAAAELRDAKTPSGTKAASPRRR